jgi:hypothetical protein
MEYDETLYYWSALKTGGRHLILVHIDPVYALLYEEFQNFTP